MLNLFLPRTRVDTQSKECQKRHWKVGHKVVCPTIAAVSQTLGEPPEQNARAKKPDLWMNAWASTISCCLSVALDLANHEWGRHETHAYVPSAPSSMFVFSDSTPTRSLIMFMEHTGLDSDHELYRVGEFPPPNTSA